MAYKFSLGKYKHSGSLVSADGLQVTGAVNLPNDSIDNAELLNDTVTIGSTAVALGATVTSFSGLANVSATAFTGSGANLTNLTSSNMVNFQADVRKQVSADGDGIEFNAGTGVFSLELTGTSLAKTASGLRTNLSVAIGAYDNSGSLLPDNNTGVLTFRPVDPTWVKGLVSANNGVAYNSGTGVFSLDSAAAGAGIGYSAGVLSIAGDGALKVATDGVYVSSSIAGQGLGFVSGAAPDSVVALNVNTAGAMTVKNDKVMISASVAGNGLSATVDGDGAVTQLDVQATGALEVFNDKIRVLTAFAGTGLTTVNDPNDGLKSISVTYGSSAGQAVQGNQGWSITAGNGLTGDASGQLGGGLTATLAVGAGNGIEVAADTVAVKLSGAAGNQALVVNADGLDLKQTIGGNRTFSNDVTINGNFYVYGSTISASVSELLVEDAKIRIADGAPALSASQGFEIGNNLATFVVGDGSSTNSAFVSSLELKASKFIGAVEGSVVDSLETVTGATTLSKTVTLCNASSAGFTVTLPTAVGKKGQFYKIKKYDNTENAVVIDGDGSETIDGVATVTLDSPYAGLLVVSDGANWFIF